MSRVSKLLNFSLRSAGRHARSWKVMPTSMIIRMNTGGRNSSNTDQNIISLIKEDHSKIRNLFEQFEKASDKTQREEAVRLSIRELSLHASKEEMVLYDNLHKSKLLPNGKEIAEHGWHEHEEVKKLLYQLDMKLKPTDAQYVSTFEKVMKNIRDHMKEEEEQVLSALEQNCDKQKLMDLGKSFMSHESIAPTRPHPAAPDKGILGKMANASAKPIDEMRDMLNPPTSSEKSSSTKKDYSNMKQDHSNMKQDHSNMKQDHSNTEKNYSSAEKNYSSAEKNYSGNKNNYSSADNKDNDSGVDSSKNSTYRPSH